MNKQNKKPKPFYAPGSKTVVTQNEIKARQTKRKRAEAIGTSITKFTDNEIENPYRVMALVYINKGEEIPKELLEKMKNFDKEYGISQ